MIQNRRDLGGLVTTDGRMIRPGMLVRSAHLFQAEAEDLAGITEVIDLRTPAAFIRLTSRMRVTCRPHGKSWGAGILQNGCICRKRNWRPSGTLC